MTLNLNHYHHSSGLAPLEPVYADNYHACSDLAPLDPDTKTYNPEHDFGTGCLPPLEPCPPMTLDQIEADLRRINAKLVSLETWVKAQGCEL